MTNDELIAPLAEFISSKATDQVPDWQSSAVLVAFAGAESTVIAYVYDSNGSHIQIGLDELPAKYWTVLREHNRLSEEVVPLDIQIGICKSIHSRFPLVVSYVEQDYAGRNLRMPLSDIDRDEIGRKVRPDCAQVD